MTPGTNWSSRIHTNGYSSTEVPEWVHALDMAVWVKGPDGNIVFVNHQAEELLGLSAADCLGLPCHRVIGGVDATGDAFCGPQCPVICQANRNGKIAPVKFRIPGSGDRDHAVLVITIMVETPSGTSLVHCAVDIDEAQRVKEYFTRVASRTPGANNGDAAPSPSVLTARESEVLALLAEDNSTYAIAAALHVSHATVRNHVQRVVAKLGAHSTLEAVARHLLSGE